MTTQSFRARRPDQATPRPGRLQPDRAPAGDPPPAAQPAHGASSPWSCRSFFFLLFGLNNAYANESSAPGHGNVSAFVMISMALYGAVLATTSGGAMVSIERAAGWSRQLRLTPLSPVAYIAIKMLTAMVLGLGSVIVVFVVGGLTGKPSMPVYLWIVTAALASGSARWCSPRSACSWATCCRPRTSCSSSASCWCCCRFAGGLFIPLQPVPARGRRTSPSTRRCTGSTSWCTRRCSATASHLAWVANAVVWLAIFAGGRGLAVPQGHRPGLIS